MTAIFMASCYQAEFRFAIEQTGIVRGIKRIIFSPEPEADRDLRRVEELALQRDHAIHKIGRDKKGNRFNFNRNVRYQHTSAVLATNNRRNNPRQ